MSDSGPDSSGSWSQARFRALTENSGDIISLMDGEGHLVFNSTAAERISGFTREELAKADTFAFMHPDDREIAQKAFAAVLATPDAVVTVQYRYRHKSGGWTWMEAVASNRLHDPEVRGVVANSRDITERKRAEEELRRLVALNEKLVADLREANERKNMFLAMLSHELRNPLSAIRNSVGVLEKTSDAGEGGHRAVSVIDRQSRHLSRLMDDLLDVTRISSGKIRLSRERLDLRDLVRRTVDDLQPVLEGHVVELTVPDEELPIDADPVRLTQVTANLLRNAAKFTPPEGRISVRLSASLDEVALEVSDTGVGLDEATLSRIFEPFMQSDRTLDRSGGGLGLGLSLVKGIVDLHGGSVRGESDGLGRGARFTVRLPLARIGEARVTAEPRREVVAQRTILVIDDNQDSAESLGWLLRLLGHRVIMVHSGREGLEKARELRPEIVVCDIGLPEMDGYDVARALREDAATAAARLIALSGYTQPDDRERARKAGFDVFLAKPVEVEVLEGAIAEALRTSAQRE
ncbi:MAG: ATP-binding protein [Polyangiales bacterium]